MEEEKEKKFLKLEDLKLEIPVIKEVSMANFMGTGGGVRNRNHPSPPKSRPRIIDKQPKINNNIRKRPKVLRRF